MRLRQLGSFLFCVLTFTVLLRSQQAQPAVQRDSQAAFVLQRSLAAMSQTLPADSVATGTITFVEGSKTSTGSVRILTRGLDQTSEELQLPDGTRTLTYSQGLATEILNSTANSLQQELAVTAQSTSFPLPLLGCALNNAETALQYIGIETLDGVQVHHIRFWSTFLSTPKLQPLAEFSTRDVWVDVATGLPRKLSYVRREARGSAPRIPVDVFYSNYQTVAGTVVPFSIQKSLNGTPWATITIQSIQFNTGLTDSAFPIQ